MGNGGAKGFISTAGKRTGVVKSGRRWETIGSFGLYFRSTQLDENLSLPESKPRYGFRYTRRRSPESAENFKRKDLQQCTYSGLGKNSNHPGIENFCTRPRLMVTGMKLSFGFPIPRQLGTTYQLLKGKLSCTHVLVGLVLTEWP